MAEVISSTVFIYKRIEESLKRLKMELSLLHRTLVLTEAIDE